MQALDLDVRRSVLAVAEERKLRDGDVLCREGEHGRDLFVVIEGALEVRSREGLLSMCRPGDVVGEIAFLDGRPRSADVAAVGATVVLHWTREALEALFRRDPRIRASVLQGLALKQAQAVRRLTQAATVPAPPQEPVPLGAGRWLVGEPVVVGGDGERVGLSPTEARLLSYFVARPGRTLAYRTLLDEVWGYSGKVTSRTVYATVHRLRSKVEADPREPRHILTVPGVGYRFEP